MGAVIHVAFNRIHGQLVVARTSSLILLAQPLRTTIQYAVCLSHDILQVNICILVMRRSSVGVGAGQIDSKGCAGSFFSEKVPDDWMGLFLQESNHPIFELELLPVLVALCVWEEESNTARVYSTWIRRQQG
jgi:hypothetical protein